jgi:hypothetical protein
MGSGEHGPSRRYEHPLGEELGVFRRRSNVAVCSRSTGAGGKVRVETGPPVLGPRARIVGLGPSLRSVSFTRAATRKYPSIAVSQTRIP